LLNEAQVLLEPPVGRGSSTSSLLEPLTVEIPGFSARNQTNSAAAG